MRVAAKMEELGLVLPAPMKVPEGFRLPFAKVRIRGKHAYVAGHHALTPDGSLAPPSGKVGVEVTPEQAYRAARLAALAMLADLKQELGDLDRVSAWLRVFGMVNSSAGFDRQPNVIDGFSDLILEVEAEIDRGESFA